MPEQYSAEVAIGRAVSFEVDASPGKTFEGQVRYVSPALEANSRTLIVEAVVPNDAGALRPGSFATALIEQGSRSPGILVPAAAVRTVAGTSRVFVVSGDRAEERIVTVGQPVNDLVEITSGLKAGETVATSSVAQLADGVRVAAESRCVMQWLAELCVRRPVFASVLILSLVVVGAFAFGQLGVDRLPQVDFPTVTVTTRLPGAAPEQVESEVTDKVEEAVNTISGIDQLNSNSAEGISQVIVTFHLEKNADVAAQEVRDRINRILPILPRTITQPTIEKQDPDSFPVLTVAVSAKKPIRDVTEYTDKVLRRRLESADGVGQVLVIGGRKRQINVWVDANRLRAYNLTVNDVARTLQSQNADIPGGRIDEGAQSITMRTRGRVETPDEFGDLVLRQVDGHPVQVNDVGRVDDGVAEATTLASINGDPTVLLQIRKQSGTNTVEVVNNVKERLADIQAALPAGYQLRIVRDGAEFIEASIRSVQEHLIVGSFLAAFVVLLFLGNLRSTIIAAISIPTSIIATFALLWYNGFTLNMLTMLALTLSVGIVIDDAIVVLENIYRFIEEKGMPPMQAAIEGTKEIGLAVMATTLSLVAIFAPVGFMSGMVGRFMRSFGLTMAFAVMVSLLVSFTLMPTMSARWLKVKPRTEDEDHHVHDSKHSKIFGPLDRVYTRMLEWSMAHRGIVAALAVVVLFSSVPMFRIVNVNFTPQDDQSEFDVSLRAPEGTSLEATEVMTNRVAAAHSADPRSGLHDGHRRR